MKYITCCLIALTGTLIGVEKKTTPPPTLPPFDADLYRKDQQVISFHGEFLFWRVQEGALDYATKMRGNAWGPSQCYAQGKVESATFDGEPGFRVAASFFRAPKYWEVWGQYTRLTANGNNQSSKPHPDTEYVTGTWPQIFTNPMAGARSHIHLNYNVADFLADRVFLPNPHLRIRLMGGGSGAWMDQFWKIKYVDSGSFETKISNRWKFFGGGLRLGTLFDWYWFNNIYITGGATFAAFLGSYHNSSFQNTNFKPTPSFDTSLPVRDTKFRDIRAAYLTQFYFGPSYQRNFVGHRIELFAGYEINAWWNLQEIHHSTSGGPLDAKETWINTSMLALQGLTARLTVDF